MNIRIPYAKLKQKVIDTGMTYAQINARDWPFALSDFLDADEIAEVKRMKNLILRWLKEDFKERQYTGTLKAPLFTRLDDMAAYLETQGVSTESGEAKLDRAYSEWKESRNG